MLISEHSAFGALAASALTAVWNKKYPEHSMSVLWMSVMGAIVARLPDWDLVLIEIVGYSGSNWAHRSIYTHSILAIAIFALLAFTIIFVANKMIKKYDWGSEIPIQMATLTLTIAFMTHLMMDVIEKYPTRILYPFSDAEFVGWVPSSVYYNDFFELTTWIIGFGGSIGLSIIDSKRRK